MRGALITVTCDCGERHLVPYGERLECVCGRRWDTNQIPAEEYWGVMHDMRRYRFRAMGMAVAIAAFAIAFAKITRGPVMPIMLLVMMAWFLFYMPQWRRRVRVAARALPPWNLHPE
ncbi:MAG: hypothetical protein ABI869_01935 [Actinomycetota bacterium]